MFVKKAARLSGFFYVNRNGLDAYSRVKLMTETPRRARRTRSFKGICFSSCLSCPSW